MVFWYTPWFGVLVMVCFCLSQQGPWDDHGHRDDVWSRFIHHRSVERLYFIFCTFLGWKNNWSFVLLISKVISTKIFPVLLLNIKYVFAKNFFSWDIYHIDQPNCLDVYFVHWKRKFNSFLQNKLKILSHIHLNSNENSPVYSFYLSYIEKILSNLMPHPSKRFYKY